MQRRRNFLNFHRRRDFLPGSALGLFCLGVPAYSSTWHKFAFCGCKHPSILHFFMQFKMFFHGFSLQLNWLTTDRWLRPWFPNLKHLLLNFQAGAFASQREELRGSGNYRKHLQGLRELQTPSVTMKVTVTFGDTAVVVPCKAGWTVRDLIDQATRRYRRILEQVNTEHILLI